MYCFTVCKQMMTMIHGRNETIKLNLYRHQKHAIIMMIIIIKITMAPVTSLSQLQLRPWAFSTHQLATSWLILEGGSPSILARLGRPAIYFKGFLFWCSALMLFCCMTVCRRLTARIDNTFVLLSQFLGSLGNEVPRVQKIIMDLFQCRYMVINGGTTNSEVRMLNPSP